MAEAQIPAEQRRYEQIVPSNPWEPITPFMWERLHARWARPERIVTAMRLAKNLDTCRALLAGEPVSPGRVDQVELRKAERQRLVRLDMSAIDQLTAA